MHAAAVGDIVVDGHWERVRALEDHAHALAQVDEVHVLVVDVPVIERDLAVDLHAVDEIIHAVERAQERGLAAARGANECDDFIFRHLKRDIKQGLMRPVIEIEVLCLHFHMRVPPKTKASLRAA